MLGQTSTGSAPTIAHVPTGTSEPRCGSAGAVVTGCGAGAVVVTGAGAVVVETTGAVVVVAAVVVVMLVVVGVVAVVVEDVTVVVTSPGAAPAAPAPSASRMAVAARA